MFENGNTAALRHVTVDGIIIKDKKILLVQRSKNVSNEGKYCLPGGYLERDENLEEGVKREVKEETGYEAASVKLFKIYSGPDETGEDRQNVRFVYIVTVSGQTSHPDHEVMDIKWFSVQNLPQAEEFAFDHYDNIQDYLQSLKVQL